MTQAPRPTEQSKKQRDNIKTATKHFDYLTIADRLRTVLNPHQRSLAKQSSFNSWKKVSQKCQNKLKPKGIV